MSQTRISHTKKAKADPLVLNDLKAPEVGASLKKIEETVKQYKKKQGGKICVCDDPNCTIGPFKLLAE